MRHRYVVRIDYHHQSPEWVGNMVYHYASGWEPNDKIKPDLEGMEYVYYYDQYTQLWTLAFVSKHDAAEIKLKWAVL